MKSSPFCDCLAHPGDPLPLHLERVATRAVSCIALRAGAEARRIAYWAGVFHDIGKATPFFQERLLHGRAKSPLTSHAQSGAALAWWYSGHLEVLPRVRLGIFLAVLRHHGALDCDDWPVYMAKARMDAENNDATLHRQLESMDLDGIRHWLEGLDPPDGTPATLPRLTPRAVTDALLERDAGSIRLRRAFDGLEQALSFLAGFGALLAVDKIDAALQGAHIARAELPADAVEVYKRRRFEAADLDPMNARRRRIAEEVQRVWLASPDQHLWTLTAPTGSGKTLAVLGAALAMRDMLARATGQAPRIIYCLPFTSVIDQNHEVFAAVIAASGLPRREDLLLKHHHLVEGVYRDADTEYAADGAGQLLTETWQSELVVTTFHQLLHTLLSNRNADLKRASQLSGALVLLDEVQAVPLRWWQGLRHLFQAAAAALDTRFVLLTATRPLIFRPEDARELLPSHPELFAALSRVQLLCHHRESLSLDDFADRLLAHHHDNPHSALIILNRRAAVRDLFQRLTEGLDGYKLVALSTDLTPRDRRIRIRLIQRFLRRSLPLIVVSTQLIEAGVDLSFPVVHRDLAPLDAIVQSAGRCNRHGTGVGGEVNLWQLHGKRRDGSPGGPLWQRVYDCPLIEATVEVLGERETWQEQDFLELSQAYFAGCWQRMDQSPVDQWLLEGDFKRVHRDFRLIEDGPPRRTLFISAHLQDQRLWELYAAIQADPDLSPREREQRFRPLRRAFYERVVQVYGTPDPVEPIQHLASGPGRYTRETGFIGREDEGSSCIF